MFLITTSRNELGAILLAAIFAAIFTNTLKADDQKTDWRGPPDADGKANFYGPPGQPVDLLHPPPPTSQPVTSAGPTLAESITAEWADRLLHAGILSKAATVFDFESAWLRGFNECGPGCAVVDVTTKGIAAFGGFTVAMTFGLGLAELGPPGEAVAASLGILFADQLEHTLRNYPGFNAARQDIGERINSQIQ